MTATSNAFKDIVPPYSTPPFPLPLVTIFAPAGILTSFKRMCGRYRRTSSKEELARLYHISIPKQTDLPIIYNIAPSQKGPDHSLQPEKSAAFARRPAVGLIPYLAKDPKIAYRTINLAVDPYKAVVLRFYSHQDSVWLSRVWREAMTSVSFFVAVPPSSPLLQLFAFP